MTEGPIYSRFIHGTQNERASMNEKPDWAFQEGIMGNHVPLPVNPDCANCGESLENKGWGRRGDNMRTCYPQCKPRIPESPGEETQGNPFDVVSEIDITKPAKPSGLSGYMTARAFQETPGEETLSDWAANGAVGQAPGIKESPRGESTGGESSGGDTTIPRVKRAGRDGYTEMTLRDIGEMLAVHTEHYHNREALQDCACRELVERALLRILLAAQQEAEKNGPQGGRLFRGLLREAVNEL